MVTYEDSFEAATIGENWSLSATVPTLVTTAAKTGIQSVQFAAATGESTSYMWNMLEGSPTSVAFRAYFRFATQLPQTNEWTRILDIRVADEASMALVQIRPDGFSLSHYDYNKVGEDKYTETLHELAWALNQWYCLEVVVKVGDDTGEYHVYLNGVESTGLARTGCKNDGGGALNALVVGIISGTRSAAFEVLMDDVSIVTGTTTPSGESSNTTIKWSGETWAVKGTAEGYQTTPGECFYSNSSKNVYVDGDGKLHLKIVYRDELAAPRWCTAEVTRTDECKYGTYLFQTTGSVRFDPNVVFGMFTWDTNKWVAGTYPVVNPPTADFVTNCDNPNTELDIEYSQWGSLDGGYLDPAETKYLNGPQFSVHPRYQTETIDGWLSDWIELLMTDVAPYEYTHAIVWSPTSIYFIVAIGHHSTIEAMQALPAAQRWTFEVNRAIAPTNSYLHINLWLYDANGDDMGDAPTDDLPQEAVLDSFVFVPYDDSDDDVVVPAPANTNLYLSMTEISTLANEFYAGDTVAKVLHVKDNQGTAVDPTTITVSLLAPGKLVKGTPLAITDLTKLATGTYLVSMNLPTDAKQGIWWIQVKAVSGTVQNTDRFQIYVES